MSSSATLEDIQTTAINTIRTLSMDGVQKANSGHPGTPMALAPVTYKLWADVLNYDPSEPLWPGRDRYVLSCGHASMLIYSMIHLAGVKTADENGNGTDEPALTLEDLKQFRQFESRTPGHPEVKHTYGVETTTGPLGQGCGNSVGMAAASLWLGANYNKPGYELFDYNVYVQCSDGDLMEGVCCEAASIAGHMKLSNLCWVYDDNNITIEGDTDLAFTENVAERFRGLGWAVQQVDDANDLGAMAKALDAFQAEDAKPTIIILKSVIGYGSPNKANTHGAHGAPLGEEEIKLTKEAYGWPADEKFLVPEGVCEHFQETLGARGKQAREDWNELFAAYKKEFASEAAELEQIFACQLPAGWDAEIPTFDADPKGLATRKSSGMALNGAAKNLPWLIGGSADLAPSTLTLLDNEGDFQSDNHAGRNFHFGIREHGMASMANGMALCGVRPYVATFFVFSDYLRPAMRLSAIMKVPVIYVFTHDSIGVGEDGPTHQPVEQLAAARAIPWLTVFRPGDANETAEAWRAAIANTCGPTVLVLTRQNLPTLCRDKYAPAENVAKGAYVMADADGSPDVILMASGSELSIATEAYEKLASDGVKARLVSVPSMERFGEQDQAYKDSVLPPGVTKRVAVEAGIQQPWDRYLGLDGVFIGMDGYGSSAPYQQVYEDRGITPTAVYDAAKKLLG
ncbi:Transketolase [Pseudobythopirellula maris]|uniref:Transketolase n=1 Tax=Pseudobythopirellula maris TaxID=2527991 RepID=A0A5C5ZS33_9BACT|nr:transketolase [Pseudobythopirellula maris]TWT90026.1 Transketolase [Pseudobythopirellula maris]